MLGNLVQRLKPIGDNKKTRFQFWKLVTDLFSANFMKQIYDWCEDHKLKLTGHFVLEETLESQLITNGAVMPHYEYFHVPGMDWLTRNIYPCLTHYQLASVAHQLGKKQILSETFALCGHNVGLDELKRILEWQMVRGINLMCPHLQGYSLRGIRKRDYPPAMYYQQPWWSDYPKFIDAMTRIGMLLTEGEVEVDTLLIHPQSTAWTYYDDDKNEGLEQLNEDFLNIIEQLEGKHVQFHLGDETIMQRHARVEGNKLVVGAQRYCVIILPKHEILFDSTKELLNEFVKNGGAVLRENELEKLPPEDIIDNKNITYTKRLFEDYILHYFVNTTNEVQAANIYCKGKALMLDTGETAAFCGQHTFGKYESLVLIEDGTEWIRKTDRKQEILPLDGEWTKVKSSANSLTLDFCDYYFDGKLIEKNGYVLNIQNRAIELNKPVHIRLEYKINVEQVPNEIYLVSETPEIFDVLVNEQNVSKWDCGYFVDKSFRKTDISHAMVQGENIIVFEVDFKQSQKVYENVEKSKIFESEKNKLTYDMEIEPVYLVGDFDVKTSGEFLQLDKDACRYSGGFSITNAREKLQLNNLEKQGYPFFAGEITLKKAFNLSHTNYCISFNKKGINVVKIKVNGNEEKTIMWEPQKLDISSMLAEGNNEIEITLVNNLRNLLGPHHLKEGECYIVCPHSFYKENCVWNMDAEKDWDEDYCFVETGLSTRGE